MSDTPRRRDSDELPTLRETPGLPTPDVRNQYAAIVVPDDDGSRECTIFPVDVTEEDLVTTWVSAEAGSYVALAEMR